MSGNYIDKLVSDIQEYLKEEEERSLLKEEIVSLDGDRETESEIAQLSPRRNILLGATTLLAACAVGSIAVAIMLLGILGGPGGSTEGTLNAIWLFAAGGCGIFFSTMLVSSWKRLVLLDRIERNTRQILESKQAANELLEDYIRKIS